MSQPADTHLTPKIAREICQRTQSAAVLEGSIASLDNEYIVGIKAVNCANGDVLTQRQVRAEGKPKFCKRSTVPPSTSARSSANLSAPSRNLTRLSTAPPPLRSPQSYSTARKIMLGTQNRCRGRSPT